MTIEINIIKLSLFFLLFKNLNITKKEINTKICPAKSVPYSDNLVNLRRINTEQNKE